MTWWIATAVVTVVTAWSSRRRSGAAGRTGVADVLDLLALGLRRGLSLTEAVEVVVRLGPPRHRPMMRVVAARRRLGAPMDLVLADLPNSPITTVLTDLDAAERWGTDLAGELDRVRADVVRLDDAVLARAARRAAVWQLGPLVCCHLPAFVLVGIVPVLDRALG